ncbi:15831_t:CDS:2 [Gigaspora margarita]|uniref:15831_t:CDS:1 n=1 Tax=Gigaspora margarita TaxID=4874 RepID=A0ABM8W2W0_GIGMA|nr:15831_t:CDS:2 [Gigaspora margarita]
MPKIPDDVPGCYVSLMKLCLSKDPRKRPMAKDVQMNIIAWLFYYYFYDEINNLNNEGSKNTFLQFLNADKLLKSKGPTLIHHPEAYHISRLISFPELKDHFDSEDNLCPDCNQQNTSDNWCKPCNAERFRQNFSKWTSCNVYIDKFIQDSQLTGRTVALKRLHNSSSINDKFLDEFKITVVRRNLEVLTFIKVEINFDFLDPETSDYMVVIFYTEGGSLKDNLQQIYKEKWEVKLNILHAIIDQLNKLHKINLIHRDLHSGNILITHSTVEHEDYYLAQVSDFGLSRPRPSADLLKNILHILMNYRKAKTDHADERAKLFILQFLEADSKSLPPIRRKHHPEAYHVSRCLPKLEDSFEESESIEILDSQGMFTI